MRKVIIIPARLESTRLPRKLLLPYKDGVILDQSIAIAKQFENEAEIVLATDNDEIAHCGYNRNIKVIKTGSHINGTSRITEAARYLQLGYDDIIVNLQGDVVKLDKEAIRFCLATHKHGNISSVYYTTTNGYTSPNNVKVVTDYNDYALYFSRLPIPYNSVVHKVHIGVYGFIFGLLQQIEQNGSSALAEEEQLEQLSWLYHGLAIKMKEVGEANHIDTQKDYEQLIKE